MEWIHTITFGLYIIFGLYVGFTLGVMNAEKKHSKGQFKCQKH